MKYAEVAENVKRLVENPPSQDEFIYELLLAYGSPKSGVTLVKKGTRNLAKEPGAVLCYNTFPIPDLTEGQKQTITMHVGEVLTEREAHSEKTMAQLYDPDKMPDGLRAAHHNLDLAVDRLYRTKPFTSDEERLEHLFKLYEEMTAAEQLV